MLEQIWKYTQCNCTCSYQILARWLNLKSKTKRTWLMWMWVKSYFTIPHTSSSFIFSLKWLGISFTKVPFLFGSCCVCHSYQINDIVLPYINVHTYNVGTCGNHVIVSLVVIWFVRCVDSSHAVSFLTPWIQWPPSISCEAMYSLNHQPPGYASDVSIVFRWGFLFLWISPKDIHEWRYSF